jgi:hypothetical protein
MVRVDLHEDEKEGKRESSRNKIGIIDLAIHQVNFATAVLSFPKIRSSKKPNGGVSDKMGDLLTKWRVNDETSPGYVSPLAMFQTNKYFSSLAFFVYVAHDDDFRQSKKTCFIFAHLLFLFHLHLSFPSSQARSLFLSITQTKNIFKSFYLFQFFL